MKNANQTVQRSPEQSAVVERTCRILRELARYGSGGARLVDLTNATSLTRPAALRILRSLCYEGLVQQEWTRRYRLGPAMYQMGLAAPSPLGDLEPFRKIVRDLAGTVGDVAYLSMRQGDHAHYLLRERGAFPVRTHLVQVGDSKPLTHTYGGITILSSMPPSETGAILARWARSGDAATPQRSIIERMLRRAKEVGYVSGADLIIEGVAGVGVPISTPAGVPFLALTISAITSRLEGDRLEGVGKLVMETASRIAEALAASEVPYLQS